MLRILKARMRQRFCSSASRWVNGPAAAVVEATIHLPVFGQTNRDVTPACQREIPPGRSTLEKRDSGGGRVGQTVVYQHEGAAKRSPRRFEQTMPRSERERSLVRPGI